MELLPCPFCGSSELKTKDYLFKEYIVCNRCWAMNFKENWNTRPSPWISVNDHLPKLEEYVLTSCKRIGINNIFVDANRMNGNIKTGWWSDRFDQAIIVTHWMPIPFPPMINLPFNEDKV